MSQGSGSGPYDVRRGWAKALRRRAPIRGNHLHLAMMVCVHTLRSKIDDDQLVRSFLEHQIERLLGTDFCDLGVTRCVCACVCVRACGVCARACVCVAGTTGTGFNTHWTYFLWHWWHENSLTRFSDTILWHDSLAPMALQQATLQLVADGTCISGHVCHVRAFVPSQNTLNLQSGILWPAVHGMQ